ncbi:HAD family hydrolase [Breznakiella homolactica]|uniref:HAD-IA family hydrolase n=1 Tax=Breznakiella homolactica TaxID=2798577 RepID=A0A7T8B9Q2_9SPIR|nr:HAD-IA family hydrolase [Breznakiella homolactica]QQO08541.1 HAD-IA family hydrolase [Breznakiella homolactica]
MLKALIFDLGGTLINVTHKEEYNLPCGTKILDYLARHDIYVPFNSTELIRTIAEQKERCWKIRTATCREIAPFELWSEWYLKDLNFNRDKLRVIANNIAEIWERNYYRMELRPETPAMLEAIYDTGIAMGVISNTVCFNQAMEDLYQFGIRRFFKTVYLSSVSGFIKPHPELFIAAARDLGVLPEECIYVGDTISRDVRGARNAGYKASIRIDSYLSGELDTAAIKNEDEADFRIESLNEIPGIVKGLLHHAEN